ncbi:hypothetical protein GOC60_32480 [Sinorhizobium meliloti]|nr:hypothetical protein [Sinorhizobium meliloti]MDX0265774.1 hypothetical protein [Sinorhizobium meliloti]MDX0353214.1 hypothetical protein [Sinorhizobium meliloti]
MLERLMSKAEWTRVAFGDVVRLSKVRIADPDAAGIERVIGLEHIEPGDLRIRRWGDVTDGTTFTTLFKPGQVLFGKRRAYQRKVAVADFQGVCSGDIYVLEPANDRLMPELLPFLCQTDDFFDHAVRTSAGSLSPRTNWTSLASFEFLLPPVHEQARLVNLLVANRMLVEALKDASAAMQRARVALRNHLFSGAADAEGVKATALGELPVSWKVVPLAAAFEFLDNRRIPLKESDRSKRKGPFPYYGASGPIDTIDDFLFDEPTILLAEDGMNLVFRNTPIAIKATGKYWVNNHAHVLRPRKETDIDFFLEYLNHISYLPYITGTDQKKITKDNCERIPIVLPPFARQSEISIKLAVYANEQAAIEKRIEDAASLKISILQEFAS